MNAKIIVSFLAGLGIGGIVGWNMCSRAYRDRLEELEIQNEDLIEENRKHAHRGAEKLSEASEGHEEETMVGNDPEEEKKKEYINYVKLSKQYQSDSFDEHFGSRAHPTDDGEDDDLVEDEADDLVKQIRVISSNTFREDLDYRDNETIVYYQEDGVLVDSANEVIKNQEDIIGDKLMGMIDDTDEDFLYVDNEFENKLYEIVVEHNESFYRDVMAP